MRTEEARDRGGGGESLVRLSIGNEYTSLGTDGHSSK